MIPMVFHALARMQWALAGAKRLECGSLLPLCFYAQTTCLEPDRHGAQNNVSVPISRHEKPSERGVLKRHKTLKRNSVGNQSHPAKANHQPEASFAWLFHAAAG